MLLTKQYDVVIEQEGKTKNVVVTTGKEGSLLHNCRTAVAISDALEKAWKVKVKSVILKA